MKKDTQPKSLKVKLLVGVVLGNGKTGKKGSTPTVGLNLGKILIATNRAELIESES